MVTTWMGHFAAAVLAVVFMMVALSLSLLWLGRPPSASCGSSREGCSCTGRARARCVHQAKGKST